MGMVWLFAVGPITVVLVFWENALSAIPKNRLVKIDVFMTGLEIRI